MLIAWRKIAYRSVTRITLLLALTGALAGVPGVAQANARLASLLANTHRSDVSLTSLQPLLIARTCAQCGHYVVTPGDSLYDIAHRFGVSGGWPELYAANRRLIGRNPDLVRVGVGLRVPAHRSTPTAHRVSTPTPSSAVPMTAVPMTAVPMTSPSAVTALSTQPQTAGIAAGMPAWLVMMLLAVGLVIAGFRKEPVPPVHHRRWSALARRAPARDVGQEVGGADRTAAIATSQVHLPSPAPAQLVFVDHERVLVTRLSDPLVVVVLRPPGQHPEAILRAARLVLPESEYAILADHLWRLPNASLADRPPLVDDLPR